MVSLEFLLTSLVVVLLPGTGVIYTLAYGLGQGLRASIIAAFGCTLGIIPSAFAAIIGLSAILHTSAVVFQTVNLNLKFALKILNYIIIRFQNYFSGYNFFI